MSDSKHNPVEGEVWEHPLTHNRYTIHSVTNDGWTRYHTEGRPIPPLYTQPTLSFITKYRKVQP